MSTTVYYDDVLDEQFDNAVGSGWPNRDWTALIATSGAASPSVTSGYGNLGVTLMDTSQVYQPAIAERWKGQVQYPEVTAEFTFEDSGYTLPGVLLHWNGSVTAPTGYQVLISKNSSNIVVCRFSGSGNTSTTLQTVSLGTFPGAGNVTTCKIRARIIPGLLTNRIQAKAWLSSASEPTDWQIDVTDSNYASGYVGISACYSASGTTTAKYVRCLAVKLRTYSTMPAPTVTLLTNNTSGTDAQSYTTASVTPTSGKQWMFVVWNSHGSNAQTPTISGNGLTWTQMQTLQYQSGARRVTVFRGSGTPTTGTVAISIPGTSNNGCSWAYIELGAELDISSANWQTNSLGSGTSGSLTWSPKVPASSPYFYTFGFWGSTSATAPTPANLETELLEQTQTLPNHTTQVQYASQSTVGSGGTFGWTWTTSAAWGAIGCQINYPAAHRQSTSP